MNFRTCFGKINHENIESDSTHSLPWIIIMLWRCQQFKLVWSNMAIMSLIAYSFLACHILTSSAFKTIVPKLNNTKTLSIPFCSAKLRFFPCEMSITKQFSLSKPRYYSLNRRKNTKFLLTLDFCRPQY
jgi:hypothetical protein